MPLKNTLKLIKKYGAKLINDTVTDTELKTLASAKNFTVSNCNKQEAMVDFVITIAPLLTEAQLHNITSKLIKCDLGGINTFWRNSQLSKYFAAYEIVASSQEQKIRNLPDKLKDHIITHAVYTYMDQSKTQSHYDNLSELLTGLIFTNAVILVKARLQEDYECNITELQSNYSDIINMQNIKTGDDLQSCLSVTPKLNLSTKLTGDENKSNYVIVLPLIGTDGFEKFRRSIQTIRNRSDYNNLLKADGIQKVVEAIEDGYDDGKILNVIAENEQDIIKNTGTGLYSFFNCGCCSCGYQSSSHKLLDKIKYMIENPETCYEATSLLTQKNITIN